MERLKKISPLAFWVFCSSLFLSTSMGFARGFEASELPKSPSSDFSEGGETAPRTGSSGTDRGGSDLGVTGAWPLGIENNETFGGSESETTSGTEGGEVWPTGSGTNDHRKRFFEQDRPRDYYYTDPTTEWISKNFYYIKTKFPAVIVGALMVVPSVLGLGYLFSSLFTSFSTYAGLPSTGGLFSAPKPHPAWLNVMNEQYERLAKNSIGLLRRVRILFGIGLISFGVSTALVVFLIEATMNNEIETIAHALSFASPVILFQAVSGFLVRQAALTQKELVPLRSEMNDVQLLMSSGLAASISETAFGKFAESLNSSNGKENGENDDNHDRPSQQDIRTLASLLAAMSRFSS